MTRNQRLHTCAALGAVLGLYAITNAATAADPAPPAVETATAPAVTAPVTTSPAATPPANSQQFLSLTDIESRLAAQGIRVREIEVHDKVVEVEGYSTKDGKLDLIVDRRNGEILSRKRDD